MDSIELTCKVNGKETPISNLSEETLLKIRRADAVARIPVARLAATEGVRNKLLLKITPEIRRYIKNQDEYVLLAIDLRNGTVTNCREEGKDDFKDFYNNIQDLTPKG